MQTFFITYALTSTVNYIVEVQAESLEEAKKLAERNGRMPIMIKAENDSPVWEA